MAFSFVAYVSVAQASSFTTPKKLADYLYYMEYSDYSADLKTGEQVKTGFACSAVRNGNFYGRNLDLDYADVPEFVIKVAPKTQSPIPNFHFLKLKKIIMNKNKLNFLKLLIS